MLNNTITDPPTPTAPIQWSGDSTVPHDAGTEQNTLIRRASGEDIGGNRSCGEQLLDADTKGVGQGESGVNARDIAAGLGRTHELSAHTCPFGELGLAEARGLSKSSQI